MTYNYSEKVKEDVLDYINENIDKDEWLGDRDGLEDSLIDDLWVEDSVTGNASGSYTFNSETARGYVLDNLSLLKDAADEFGDTERCANLTWDEELETLDVILRCYVLSGAVHDALNELEEEGYFEEEE